MGVQWSSGGTNELPATLWEALRRYLPDSSHVPLLLLSRQSYVGYQQRVSIRKQFYHCYRLLVVLQRLYHSSSLFITDTEEKNNPLFFLFQAEHNTFLVDSKVFSKRRMLLRCEPLIQRFFLHVPLEDVVVFSSGVPYRDAHWNSMEGIHNIALVYEWVISTQRRVLLWDKNRILKHVKITSIDGV